MTYITSDPKGIIASATKTTDDLEKERKHIRDYETNLSVVKRSLPDPNDDNAVDHLDSAARILNASVAQPCKDTLNRVRNFKARLFPTELEPATVASIAGQARKSLEDVQHEADGLRGEVLSLLLGARHSLIAISVRDYDVESMLYNIQKVESAIATVAAAALPTSATAKPAERIAALLALIDTLTAPGSPAPADAPLGRLNQGLSDANNLCMSVVAWSAARSSSFDRLDVEMKLLATADAICAEAERVLAMCDSTLRHVAALRKAARRRGPRSKESIWSRMRRSLGRFSQSLGLKPASEPAQS